MYRPRLSPIWKTLSLALLWGGGAPGLHAQSLQDIYSAARGFDASMLQDRMVGGIAIADWLSFFLFLFDRLRVHLEHDIGDVGFLSYPCQVPST